MPFNLDFIAIQQYPNTSNILFEDLSTGDDPNITSRRIYPRNAAGDLVLEEGNTLGYINWPLPINNTLTVDLLSKDMALNIQVVCISSSPLPDSDYDVTKLEGFTKNIKQFIYDRSQDIAAQPQIRNDTTFIYYYELLQSEVDTVELAVSPDIEDILDAQSAIDRAYFVMNNQNNFF